MHVDAIIQLSEKGRTIGRLNLPDGILVGRNAVELTIARRNTVRKPVDCRILPIGSTDYQYYMATTGTLYIKEADLSITLCEIDAAELPEFKETDARIAFFDLDRLQFPLQVRNLRSGDRFSPLGVNGSQKVKKYFIDHKIPAAQRRKCPLLLSSGNIIWVAGHRIDNAVKLGHQTQRVLKAELLLA